MSKVDLVEFLTARLDEDEQAARDAHYVGQRWISEEEGVWRWPDDEAVHTADRKRDAAHIARHDPARVLADVAAKQRIIKLHRPVMFTNADLGIHNATVCFVCHGHMDYPDDKDGEDWDYPVVQLPWPCPTILALALPYADHPDYREEWKP